MISGSHSNPWRERRRRQDIYERFVLLRVPSYFEDVGVALDAGGFEEGGFKTTFRENFGGLASELWPQWELAVRALQGTDREIFCEFERLATAVESEDRDRGVETTPNA